ncbi:MAG: serine/threonine dehydratase [Dermatophilaceae bacterium]
MTGVGSVPVVTGDDITRAMHLIAGRVRRTPVLDVTLPGGQRVTLKLELFQHTGSFKPRGAFTSVLSVAEPPALLVAASGGNHGLAVAYVGRELGIPVRVFVPESAPPVKVDGIRGRGAEVVQVGARYADALAASAADAAAPGALAVHAYDTSATVAGQGTVGLELDGQVRPDTVLVAVGGGGLVAGIATWFHGSATSVVAVEPAGCAALNTALAQGSPALTHPSGIASDSLGASTAGSIGFEVACRTGLQSVLVDDPAIEAARQWLWREVRVAAEPGGATALAALLTGTVVPDAGERVCVVVCGANADPATLAVS